MKIAMTVIELHKIQTYPASCLNRDDVGSPKTIIYGGVQRGRISSQCANAAMRKYWFSLDLKEFRGVRTRKIQKKFRDALGKHVKDEKVRDDFTKLIMEALGKIDADRPHKLTTTIFISEEEIATVSKAVADAIHDGTDPAIKLYLSPVKTAAKLKTDKKDEQANGDKEGKTPLQNSVRKLVRDAMKDLPKDAAVIALRGRMFADHTELTSAGAAVSNHPFTTHKNVNETDFFVAMEENKEASEDEDDDEGQGAAMMDGALFTSGTFYHYTAINLEDLKALLPDSTVEERQSIVRMYVTAFVNAIPSGKSHSYNADTKPGFVLVTVRTGQPFQLAGAFEAPVKANGDGYEQRSIDRLLNYRAKHNEVWGIKDDLEVYLRPGADIDPEKETSQVATLVELLDSISSHVI